MCRKEYREILKRLCGLDFTWVERCWQGDSSGCRLGSDDSRSRKRSHTLAKKKSFTNHLDLILRGWGHRVYAAACAYYHKMKLSSIRLAESHRHLVTTDPIGPNSLPHIPSEQNEYKGFPALGYDWGAKLQLDGIYIWGHLCSTLAHLYLRNLSVILVMNASELNKHCE